MTRDGAECLCENQYAAWQDCLRHQGEGALSGKSVNLVEHCCMLLHAHVETVRTTLPPSAAVLP